MFSQLRNSPRCGGKAAAVVLALLSLLPLVGMAEPAVGMAEPAMPTVEGPATDVQLDETTQAEDTDTDVEVAVPGADRVAGVDPDLEPLVDTAVPAESLAVADTSVAAMSPVPDDLVVDFEVSPLVAKPGESAKITGVCTSKGAPATDAGGTFYRLPIDEIDRSFDMRTGDIPVDGEGRVSFTYLIPLEAKPGVYELTIFCGKDDMGLGSESFDFVILDEEPVPPSTPAASNPEVLAETGGVASSGVSWGAVGAGVVGVLLVARSRARGPLVKSGSRAL